MKHEHVKPPPQFKNWQTPPDFFKPLHEKYRFTLDVAADHFNHLLPRYCTPEGTFIESVNQHPDGNFDRISANDGLMAESWIGERVFCNPPYDTHGPTAIANWVALAALHVAEFAFLLLPPSVDVSWFWEYLWHEVNFSKLGPQQMSQARVNTQFNRGRLRFLYRCEECGELVQGDAPRAGNLFAVFQ